MNINYGKPDVMGGEFHASRKRGKRKYSQRNCGAAKRTIIRKDWKLNLIVKQKK